MVEGGGCREIKEIVKQKLYIIKKKKTKTNKEVEEKDFKNNLITFDELLDQKYGKLGDPKREEWEQPFRSF